MKKNNRRLPKANNEFNPYKFYHYQKKRGIHEEAIKEALKEVELYDVDNKWAYANAILNRINGNYNERDHVARHESTKESREEFSAFVEKSDLTELLRGIGNEP